MKHTILLTALFLILLFAACSEDNTPNDPNLTESVKSLTSDRLSFLNRRRMLLKQPEQLKQNFLSETMCC